MYVWVQTFFLFLIKLLRWVCCLGDYPNLSIQHFPDNRDALKINFIRNFFIYSFIYLFYERLFLSPREMYTGHADAGVVPNAV